MRVKRRLEDEGCLLLIKGVTDTRDMRDSPSSALGGDEVNAVVLEIKGHMAEAAKQGEERGTWS